MSMRLARTTLLRPARAAAPALRPVPVALSRASLHTSLPRRASEAPEDPLADPKFQHFYEKIRNHQGAVDAMMKVGEIMKEKGELRPAGLSVSPGATDV